MSAFGMNQPVAWQANTDQHYLARCRFAWTQLTDRTQEKRTSSLTDMSAHIHCVPGMNEWNGRFSVSSALENVCQKLQLLRFVETLLRHGSSLQLGTLQPQTQHFSTLIIFYKYLKLDVLTCVKV